MKRVKPSTDPLHPTIAQNAEHDGQQNVTHYPPVPDDELDAGLRGCLQGLVGLVQAPASTVLSINLEDLVPKT